MSPVAKRSGGIISFQGEAMPSAKRPKYAFLRLVQDLRMPKPVVRALNPESAEFWPECKR
jgi:hypothetical protein